MRRIEDFLGELLGVLIIAFVVASLFVFLATAMSAGK